MLASRAGRDRRLAPLVLVLWPYLHRLATRFEALARRIEAGRAAAAPRPKPATAPPPSPGRHGLALPSGWAWLIRLAPEVAPLGSQIRHLLRDPEFLVLAADPRAGRLLRPLLRMLGIRPGPDVPAGLFPPPRPRAPAQPAPAQPSPEAGPPAARSPVSGPPVAPPPATWATWSREPPPQAPGPGTPLVRPEPA